MGSRNTTYTGNNIIHCIFAYGYIMSKLGCHISVEVEVVKFYINNFFLLGKRRLSTSFLLGREGSTCTKHVHIYSIQAHCKQIGKQP